MRYACNSGSAIHIRGLADHGFPLYPVKLPSHEQCIRGISWINTQENAFCDMQHIDYNIALFHRNHRIKFVLKIVLFNAERGKHETDSFDNICNNAKLFA